jgi:hypothetical protein
MNPVMNALRWAFGKDGTTVTQYVIIYLLFYYKDVMVGMGVPEALIFVLMSVILNLNNNALKDEINKWWDKFKISDIIVQLMKFGFSYEQAIDSINNPTVKTQISSKEDIKKIKDTLIEPISTIFDHKSE